MSPEIRFVLICFGISLVISYTWWCHVRAWILRVRLFEIRDRLWDAARAADRLDDPAHREMREVLNSLIDLAPKLSWPTFLYLLATRDDLRAIIAADPKNPEVLMARNQVTLCIADYLLRMTLTGRFLLAFSVAFGFAADLRRFLARLAAVLAEPRAAVASGG
jgi:hypothetical protein